MKKMLLVVLVLAVFGSLAIGQDWGWTGTIPPDSAGTGWPASYGQGMAVDGAGKIWYTSYYSADSVDVGDGVMESCRAIYVFNPDGTQASFSPIKTITVDGVEDTLWNSNRGLRTDPDGNIVAGSWCVYYRINHTTGAGMQKLLPFPSTDPEAGPWDGESITAAAFDADGNLYTNMVVAGGNPIKAFDTDFELLDELVSGDYCTGYSRTIEVSADANDIYFCSFTSGNGVIKFHSNDGLDGDYLTQIDTVLRGMAVEATGWQPVTNYLWAGNSGGAGWTNCGFYAYDPVSGNIMDSLFVPGAADLGAKPRGIDFTSDGNIAYVTFFNSWDTDAIYRLEKGATGVWEHTDTFAHGYKLSANYPNPFNPSTTMDYVLTDAGVVDFRVYNLKGAEVSVLTQGYQAAGEYSVTFNGSNLASGVYIAKLNVNGIILTKSMTLVK
ncbi:MAG: T9SS type A sorting domain-containing protein [Candidatus Marinimicrobia bacterium]|nr:T9SS type A sorting domain-containing protein [Candidatus Neomarinimicrobiota bacterium]